MVPQYELMETRPDGSAYVRITLDDGTTCGQEIKNAPLGDVKELEACIAGHVERIEAQRVADQKSSVISPAVEALKQKKTALPPKTEGATATTKTTS